MPDSIVRTVTLTNVRHLPGGHPANPAPNPPPAAADGSPGPPITPPPVSAFTLEFAANDPANALYPSTPVFYGGPGAAVLHVIVASNESLGPIELGAKFEIEIRRKE